MSRKPSTIIGVKGSSTMDTNVATTLYITGSHCTVTPPPPEPNSPFPSPARMITERQASQYYASLPSSPRLVAHSDIAHSPIWRAGSQFSPLVELWPVQEHHAPGLAHIWEVDVAPMLFQLFRSLTVPWTSIDVFRLVDSTRPELRGEVTVSTGVKPETLSRQDGLRVITIISKLFTKMFDHVSGVIFTIRESSVVRLGSSGPSLLRSSATDHFSIMPFKERFTTSVGTPIRPSYAPSFYGSSGCLFVDPNRPGRVFLLTARHVALPPPDNGVADYCQVNNSQARKDMLLFGISEFEAFQASIQSQVCWHKNMVRQCQSYIEVLTASGTGGEQLEKRHNQLAISLQAVQELELFYTNITRDWAETSRHALGHLDFAPRLDIPQNGETFTQDWAIIEVHSSKLKSADFHGNSLHIGTDIDSLHLTTLMYPNGKNPPGFRYPEDNILKMTGIISLDELQHPIARDERDHPCLVVLKRGGATGLTVGRASQFMSFTRFYDPNDPEEPSGISKEWPIFPNIATSQAFSAVGDSGSVVVDGLGRIGGLITGGTRHHENEQVDITYATPISFVIEGMRARGLSMVLPSL